MSRHELCYEILNAHNLGDDCTRTIDVHANPDELAQLDREGYLVCEGLFTGSALATLRDAVERLVESEWEQHRGKAAGKRSWGIILRHLMDKDPAFLELLKYPPILSVAQAMMGPLVCLRGLSGRHLSRRRAAGNAAAPASARGQSSHTAVVFCAAQSRRTDLFKQSE